MPSRGRAYTEIGWEVYPEGLTETLRGSASATATCRSTSPRTAPPSTIPPRAVDGAVDDPLRVDYLRDAPAGRCATRSTAASTCAATSSGRCSTTSSGASGYSKRFGIVHVDFETQERTLKASGRFYAEVARSRGAALDTASWPLA